MKRKPALFLFIPVGAGIVYYNVQFFRERNEKLGAGPQRILNVENEPEKTAAAAAPVQVIPALRSYDEALALLAVKVDGDLWKPENWSTRDVFVPAQDVTAAAAPAAAPTSGAAGAGGTTAPPPPAPVAAPKAAPAHTPRFDGWVKTPRGEYAIIDGRLTGTGLSDDGQTRVIKISRHGVTVDANGTVSTVPLAGEGDEAPSPRAGATGSK